MAIDKREAEEAIRCALAEPEVDAATEKRVFAEGPLAAVAKGIEPEVARLAYKRFDNGDESVNVIYEHGYTKAVNVTGDSLKALAEDVIAVL